MYIRICYYTKKRNYSQLFYTLLMLMQSVLAKKDWKYSTSQNWGLPERIHSLRKSKEASQSFLSMLLGYCCCYWWQQTAERLNLCLRISIQYGLLVNTFPSQHSVSLSLSFHTCFSLLVRIHHLFRTSHKMILHSTVKFSLSDTLIPTKTKFGHIFRLWQ